MHRIVCFGEVLWDVFPRHKKIGGAPLNVALRLKSYHNEVSMISAVGKDELGTSILDFTNEKGINSEFIAVLDDFETGEVQVSLNSKGAASYVIKYPKAWDKILWTEKQEEVVQKANAFIFGSLITRDEVSRKTLFQLLERAKYKIFDVNLRPPFYNKDLLFELMQKSDFIKFNDEELYIIASFLGSKHKNLEQNLQFMAKITDAKTICVTKGEHGAVLLYKKQLYYNSGYVIEVADTVGSGDSFLASLIDQILKDQPPQKALDFACAVGGIVASKKGANPKISALEIKNFMQ